MGRIGSTTAQRDFVKLFDSICGRYSRYQVWQDFLWLAACELSMLDERFKKERTERCAAINAKYAKTEIAIFPQLFALIVAGMEDQPDQDFLGELYMSLNMGNDRAGQFFTPYHLCLAMAEITLDSEKIKDQITRDGYISINDPACGAGATLITAANVLKKHGINYQQSVIFVGQDIDYTVGLMCYIQLSLMGCAGYVRIGNTLTDPGTGDVLHGPLHERDAWFTPMYCMPGWQAMRTADRMRKMFRAIAGPPTTCAKAIATESCKVDSEPAQGCREAEMKPETNTDSAPAVTITLNKRRRMPEGQLAFDFEGRD